MAMIKGQLFFAPGIQMKDLDLDDPGALVNAFEKRIDGLFLAPVRLLGRCGETEEGALFSAALLVAALIESLARLEGTDENNEAPIKQWLESHLPKFRETVTIDGRTLSLAAVFEQRFRNGLAHNGYVASLGRLSRDIETFVNVVEPIVTVNPFALADAVEERFRTYSEELRTGVRDIRHFSYCIRNQFFKEVQRARQET
jgi:hypothetical protein